MADQSLAYLPPKNGFYQLPLQRFIPPLPRAVISTWLDAHSRTGDEVIDPLGANPMLALEGASAGRKILFARNNPVLWLMLEVLASAPSENEISSAVSKLLLSRQGNTTLEEQLKTIYASTCFDCGEPVQPTGYIWEENVEVPTAKIYQCPSCGANGEKPVDENDILSIQRLGNIGLQRARAFQRVSAENNYERESIEEALNCYLPRAIFTLMLLVNRLDRLEISKEERLLLQAVLLTVFDDGNSLWHWPIRDHRHLQLSVPPRFLEKNLLLSLESAAAQWQSPFQKISITYYPQLPAEQGGICFYQRRLAYHEDFFANLHPKGCVALLPRPNQAFWTLSALWSGWLWGPKGAAPMRSALTRRRYDWTWFSQAIKSTMDFLNQEISFEQPIFTIFPEATANFYLGAACGMNDAGFKMLGYAYRPNEEVIQNTWSSKALTHETDPANIRELIKEYLDARGEPSNFNDLLMQIISETVSLGIVPKSIDEIQDGLFRQIQENLSTQLRDENFLITYPTSHPGGSRWFPVDTRDSQPPLSERIEHFISIYLQQSKHTHFHDLELQTCNAFPGALTPSLELIRSITDSYTYSFEEEPNSIRLREEEKSSSRVEDLRHAYSLLIDIGKSFGFFVDEPQLGTISWQTEKGNTVYRFYLKSTCDISELVFKSSEEENIAHVIVLPGSRSRLIVYRIKEDSRLASALAGNWHFLKFRHLRRLAARENLTLDLWENLMDGDPMLWDEPEQTPLL